MTITCTPYQSGIVGLASGAIKPLSAFFVSLHTAGYTPDLTGDTTWSDLNAEVVGGSYTSRGRAVSVTVAADTATGGATVRIADTTWTSATFTGVRYAVVYQYTGNPNLDPLLLLVDFGADIDPAGSNLTLDWPDAGAMLLEPEA